MLLTVEVDGAGLLGTAPAERLEAAVYVYALAAGGTVAGFFARSVAIDLEASGERLAGGGLRLLGTLELPPGAYELRALVHEPASGRHGLRATRLEIPAAATPPFAGRTAGRGSRPDSWLLAADGDGTALGLLARAGAGLPAALPVLTGETVELDLLVSAAVPPERPAPERFEARFADAEGRPLARAAAPVVARHATDLPGVERLRLALPLAGIEAGSYF
ncbi:MAG TPA: hypothetical protein VHQ65_03535, partial [Thermoanaerobaculia bacterium]|nr:hypothetical protein [Thermoanaerobaculia bacterium]